MRPDAPTLDCSPTLLLDYELKSAAQSNAQPNGHCGAIRAFRPREGRPSRRECFIERHGGPEVLKLGEMPDPVAASGNPSRLKSPARRILIRGPGLCLEYAAL
jgi:hypothetical protein